MGVPEAGPHVASGAAAHVPHVFSVLLYIYMGDVVLEFLVLPPNRGSLPDPEVIRRENPPPPTKGYLWYPPPALNGAEAGGAPRAPPRESC